MPNATGSPHTVGLIAEEHEVIPGLHALLVTPARVRLRLSAYGTEIVPWRPGAGFHTNLPANSLHGTVYAPGTRPNHPPAAGPYRFRLATAFRHPRPQGGLVPAAQRHLAVKPDNAEG